ncbi:translation initiation factor IF-2, partial [Candidatus Woesearchaeota archaeon CG11_big_fil_rev_8_21_14_0_20_57_5]
MALRSPICTVVGHVDHGKSTLLDQIRQTSIVKAEAGGITQHIGASFIPMKRIAQCCGPLLKSMGMDFTIPGILTIDTPGHAAFTGHRRRGGGLADIAILVVDINDGFMPQTQEALEILKGFKTPFIVAATKIDLLQGWKAKGGLLQTINALPQATQEKLDTQLYRIVAKLGEFGMNADRFDRVTDYTKEIGIVPVSGITGDGIPEMLMLIAGLAQRYLEKNLKVNAAGPARGTILEVKEQKGLGSCMDVIIYDGTIHAGDTLIIGTTGEPIITKAKALFTPKELGEMRDAKTKFSSALQVTAAAGVRIAAPGIEGALGGMPIRTGDAASGAEDIKKEIASVLLDTDAHGVLVKADSLGSLEAVHKLLSGHKIPVRSVAIGAVTKKDLTDAEAAKEPTHRAVLAFSVGMTDDATALCRDSGTKVISSNVIYRLIDDYDIWIAEVKAHEEAASLEHISRPCKFQVMNGYIFRQSNPAV